jgi:hypothetical protein
MKRFLAWFFALQFLLLPALPIAAQDFSFSVLPAQGPTLGGTNVWKGPNSEPPCAPAVTTGTITLALGTACGNPVVSANGGSPDNWQFTLSGNGTLATTGPYKPGQVFSVKVTEGSPVPFTLNVPAGWSVGGLCTASATPISYCTVGNELPLSGFANGKNSFTCQVIDATPTIWCPAVSAGLTAAAGSAGGPPFTLRGNHNVVTGNGVSSLGLTYSGVTPGDIGIVKLVWCNDGICSSAVNQPTSVTDGTNAFTAIPGTALGGSNLTTSEFVNASLVGTGGTVTATWSGTVDYVALFFEEWSPGAVDTAQGSTNTSSTSPMTLTSAGNMTEVGELLTSVVVMSCCDRTVTAGNTLINSASVGGAVSISQYKKGLSSGSPDTNTVSFPSGTAFGSLGVLK